jgi:hypothetical protein
MSNEQVSRQIKREGQEGNRWVNQQPSGTEISDWFSSAVPIADGLDAKDYVAGVTLIPNEEKAKTVVGWDSGNNPIIRKVTDLVLTPYMRVETRVKYFHDLMLIAGSHGFIEPVAAKKGDDRLPAGFFRMAVATGASSEVRFIGCTMRVVVYAKESLEYVEVLADKRSGEKKIARKGKIVLEAQGTKIVPALSYDKADNNSIMKAETGAVGRALGMAGVLVIPGTGIATAEDMQELNAQPADVASASAGAVLPDGEPNEELIVGAPTDNSDEKLRDEATALIKGMESFPETLAEFKSWAHERGFARLSEVTSPALRGLVKRAESMLQEAERTAAAPKEPAKEPDPPEDPPKQ